MNTGDVNIKYDLFDPVSYILLCQETAGYMLICYCYATAVKLYSKTYSVY